MRTIDERVEARRLQVADILRDNVVRSIASLMTPADRELLALWASGRVSLASLSGVLNCHAGTVSRRLRRLRARLNDPIAYVIAAHGRELSSTRRLVATRIFIRGDRSALVRQSLDIRRRELDGMLAEIRGWALARKQDAHLNRKEQHDYE